MAKRKSMSKKLRFEIFKRDKFKCQYCGKSAPNVILNVDHINPVSKGGTNEIINLITSCFDCNQGKKARLLSDDTVVVKQRKQLEVIQERREQLELMLEWKNSLSNFEDEKTSLISEYWTSKMGTFSLSESGLKSLVKLLKKFSVEDVIESIDIASDKYLKYNNDGVLLSESVENAFSKIGGICTLKNLPELKRKIAYVKGIARNRFNYWDNKKGAIILQNYIKALENANWSEEKITEDIEKELIPKTKECNNWSEWRSLLEQWTEDVNKWEKDNEIDETQNYNSNKPTERKENVLRSLADSLIEDFNNKIKTLYHISIVFPNIKKSTIKKTIISDLKQIIEIKDGDEFNDFKFNCSSTKLFEISTNPMPENYAFLTEFEIISIRVIREIMDVFNVEYYDATKENKIFLRSLLKEKLKKHCLTINKNNNG